MVDGDGRPGDYTPKCLNCAIAKPPWKTSPPYAYGGAEVNAAHFAAHPGVFARPDSPARDVAHWRSALSGVGSATFLAEVAGEVVGFLSVSVHAETVSLLQPLRFGKVGTVGVRADHRGQGIGRALMALAHEWALAQGACELRLNVWAFNTEAMRLYKALGCEARTHQMAKPLLMRPACSEALSAEPLK